MNDLMYQTALVSLMTCKLELLDWLRLEAAECCGGGGHNFRILFENV